MRNAKLDKMVLRGDEAVLMNSVNSNLLLMYNLQVQGKCTNNLRLSDNPVMSFMHISMTYSKNGEEK